MLLDNLKASGIWSAPKPHSDPPAVQPAHPTTAPAALGPARAAPEGAHVLSAFSHLTDTPTAAGPAVNFGQAAAATVTRALTDKVTPTNTPTQAAPQPANHTPAEMKELALRSMYDDAAKHSQDGMLSVLKNKDLSDADKTEVLKQMMKLRPDLAARELSDMGAVQVGTTDPKDAALVAKYLGMGYDEKGNDPANQGKDQYGKFTPTELKALLNPDNLRGAGDARGSFAVNPLGLSNLIRQADAPGLQGDAAKQMLDLAQNDKSNFGDNSAYYAAAAQAAAGSPAAAQELLRKLGPDGLEKFMDQTRPNALGNRGDTMNNPALGQFISTVGNIKPDPGDQDLVKIKSQVFDLGVKKVDDDPSMRQGLGEYFTANMDSTVDRLTNPQQTKDNDPIGNQSTLSTFMQQVMWNHNKFDSQDALRGNFGDYLQGRVDRLSDKDAYLKLLKDNPEQAERMREDAARFGGLLGATEVGFKKELDSISGENEKRTQMADALFGMLSGPAKAALPTSIIPGAGAVVDKGSDALKQKIEDWVKITPPDSKDTVLPFFKIGLQLPEGDLQTSMKDERNTTHTNLNMGYLN